MRDFPIRCRPRKSIFTPYSRSIRTEAEQAIVAERTMTQLGKWRFKSRVCFYRVEWINEGQHISCCRESDLIEPVQCICCMAWIKLLLIPLPQFCICFSYMDVILKPCSWLLGPGNAPPFPRLLLIWASQRSA